MRIPGGVLPRQTKVNQVIARGPLRPGISLRSAIEVSVPIDLSWVESVGIHSRGIEHDVVSRAIPVCDVPLMHELYALIPRQSDFDQRRRRFDHLTSQICLKNATNSPKVWKRGLLKGRKNGITISFWPALGISITSSNGTQWL